MKFGVQGGGCAGVGKGRGSKRVEKEGGTGSCSVVTALGGGKVGHEVSEGAKYRGLGDGTECECLRATEIASHVKSCQRRKSQVHWVHRWREWRYRKYRVMN